ncbi:MAG: GDSL-type esterase/lipase family protein [Synechococcales bacterium]|nr:GDSL-type esterase/lipase family protein [Synechococcales bacterium]
MMRHYFSGRMLNVLLFLLLIAAIALNIELFNQAKKYYLELNQTRLDPQGLSDYPTDPRPIAPAQSRVIFFGDSRAAAWTDPDVQGYEFINRGIGSQTTAQIIQRFSAHVRPLKPQVVVLQLGINDIKTIALFPDRKAEILANCRSNIEKIIKQSNALGATVILTTIFPVGEVPLQRKPFWSNEIAEAVKEMNQFLASLANDRVIIFDAFPILIDQKGLLRSDYRSDELHLNDRAYEVLNQELVKSLVKLKRS